MSLSNCPCRGHREATSCTCLLLSSPQLLPTPSPPSARAAHATTLTSAPLRVRPGMARHRVESTTLSPYLCLLTCLVMSPRWSSCTCPRWRDFESVDSGYCGGPCGEGEGGATCRQLAAGCGASVADIAGRANGGDGDGNVGRRGGDWGDQSCDKREIEQGQCGLCTQPLWCDDPGNSFGYGGSINTPERWMEAFFDRDGGRALGARQCKWKPSQKQMFIDTMRMRFQRRATLPFENGRHYDHANLWNEVRGEGRRMSLPLILSTVHHHYDSHHCASSHLTPPHLLLPASPHSFSHLTPPLTPPLTSLLPSPHSSHHLTPSLA